MHTRADSRAMASHLVLQSKPQLHVILLMTAPKHATPVHTIQHLLNGATESGTICCYSSECPFRGPSGIQFANTAVERSLIRVFPA